MDPTDQLVIAAKRGQLEEVQGLLDQGVTADAVFDAHYVALVEASEGNHLNVVKLLVRRGAAINIQDMFGQTAVAAASQKGHLDIVAYLYESGADIHLSDNARATPLLLAALNDHLPVCEFLLRKGADLTAPATEDGQMVLSHYGGALAADIRGSLSPETIRLRHASLLAAHTDYLVTPVRETVTAQQSRIAVLERPVQANASMLFSDAFSDLVFVCSGGERIHAHRSIVSACSPHARVMLQGPWAENIDERVAVVQMPQSAVAVRVLLRFMYTGEVDASAIETSMSDVLDLASQHEQPALINACERHAIAALSLQTVVPLLLLSRLHDLEKLNAGCVAFIQTNLAAMALSSPFIQLKASHPLVWREMRSALGVPEEEEGADGESEAKRARCDV